MATLGPSLHPPDTRPWKALWLLLRHGKAALQQQQEQRLRPHLTAPGAGLTGKQTPEEVASLVVLRAPSSSMCPFV